MANIQQQFESKKRRTDYEGGASSSSSSGDSINSRILKLEEDVIEILAKINEMQQQTKKKPPRKNSLQDVDAKLSTILGVLARLVAV